MGELIYYLHEKRGFPWRQVLSVRRRVYGDHPTTQSSRGYPQQVQNGPSPPKSETYTTVKQSSTSQGRGSITPLQQYANNFTST